MTNQELLDKLISEIQNLAKTQNQQLEDTKVEPRQNYRYVFKQRKYYKGKTYQDVSITNRLLKAGETDVYLFETNPFEGESLLKYEEDLHLFGKAIIDKLNEACSTPSMFTYEVNCITSIVTIKLRLPLAKKNYIVFQPKKGWVLKIKELTPYIEDQINSFRETN